MMYIHTIRHCIGQRTTDTSNAKLLKYLYYLVENIKRCTSTNI